METMKNLTVACLKQVIKSMPALVLSPVPQIVQIFLHFMRAYLKQWSSIIATLRL